MSGSVGDPLDVFKLGVLHVPVYSGQIMSAIECSLKKVSLVSLLEICVLFFFVVQAN